MGKSYLFFGAGGKVMQEIDTKTPTVEVNQVIEFHYRSSITKLVVVEILRDSWGKVYYKCINLETKQYETKDYIRPLSEMFGIGSYFNDTAPEFLDPMEVLILKDQADKLQEQQHAQQLRQKEENERLTEIGRQRLEKLLPEGVKALIIAEERIDDSDSYTDYFGHTVGRTVILGYSFTERNNFAEMRKFASRFEPTAYLSEYNKDYEHREDYTGGGGYYLGAHRRHGWVIEKERYGGREGLIKRYSLIAGDEENVRFTESDTQQATTATAPIVTEGVQIIDYSEKSIAVIGDTKPIKDTLRALRGSFNFRLTVNGEKTCGWIYPKSREQEIRTALNL